MFLGRNLQYLRRVSGGMTQEKLAEQIGVSRQTVSKWESGEATPEVQKLMDLCEIFHCRLDDLLRQDMAAQVETYSPVRIQRVRGFRSVQYIVISEHPEEDSAAHMEHWIQRAGLNQIPGYRPIKIGWRFPYVSAEQKNRFGLRGYVCCCLLPEGSEPDTDGMQIMQQKTADYAVMTIREPKDTTYNKVSQAYHLIFEYLNANGFKKKHSQKILPAFELAYKKDGIDYMDIFVHCDSGGKISNTIQFI